MNLNAATSMELSKVRTLCDGLVEAVDMISKKKVLIAYDADETINETFGKMLAYAGAIDAKILVWIAAHVTLVHAAACAWLSDHSVGIELHLLEARCNGYQTVFEITKGS